jgi:hypothetical protein
MYWMLPACLDGLHVFVKAIADIAGCIIRLDNAAAAAKLQAS